MDILEEKEGTEAVITLLSNNLQEQIPRLFEEKLRYKLAKLYLEAKNYNLAANELQEIIQKFNSSTNMAEYITKYNFANLKLKRYETIITDYQTNLKYFNENKQKQLYSLYVAKAYFKNNNYDEAEKIIEKNIEITTTLAASYRFLQAEIWETTNRLRQAVEQYQELLRQNSSRTQEILMKLGDIYFNNFQNFKTAQKYYNRLITDFSTSPLKAEASYKLALTYEKQDDIQNAISELKALDLTQVEDANLEKKIRFRLEYLSQFQNKNYEKAVDGLISTFYNYVQNQDTAVATNSLIKILSEDLKQYERSITLLSNQNDAYSAYLRSKIYLQLASRYKLEGDGDRAKSYFAGVDSLQIKFAGNQQWNSEIKIKKQIFLNGDLNEDIVTSMEVFVSRYAVSQASNEFILQIADYFHSNQKYEKAAGYFQQLQKTDNINQNEFYEAKITLAEYFYSQNDDEKALQNYALAENYINLQKPLILFHYAVVLHEQGYRQKALQKLKFLLNNSGDFSAYKNAVYYFTSLLRSQEKFTEVVDYMLLVPQQKRDDEFYQQLAQDYLALGKLEEAKESLMYVSQKSTETLAQLAKLQFQTKDWEIAKYSLNKLISENSSQLQNYMLLAQIYFQQENYEEAQKLYATILKKLAGNYNDFDKLNILATQYAISLYQRENRPKAEKITKQFAKHLNNYEKNRIELHRGIYYIKLEPEKAAKILSKILEKEDLQPQLMIEVYYWRGVAYLGAKQLEKAQTDFKTVANSVDEKLSNQAYLKLGTINFSQENYQQALTHYYRVIQQDTDGQLAFDAAKNFAYVCKTIEEWQKAVDAYQIILNRWGDADLEAQTIFDIAFCHYRDKKYDKAIEMFRQSLQLIEDAELQAEVQYWLADSYFGMDNYETAVTEFLKVSYNYNEFLQWAALSELRAAQSYLKMNNLVKAKRLLNRIIDKYGAASDWGKEAVKILKELQ
jgi:tetratricopeptide (TPR) repeat protein